MQKRTIVLSLLCMLLMMAAFALSPFFVWPVADEATVKKNGKLVVDCSHMEDGYVMVKGAVNSKRYKLRVKYGQTTLTYDMNNAGEYEIIPLQMGSGQYAISLYVNTGEKKYATAGSVKIKVQLVAENAAMLIPNQYVYYGETSPVVALSQEICEGLSTPREKYQAITAYIKRQFHYDYLKAATVTPGAMPSIDACLQTKSGICQDLAAMSAAMLRVQGIPTRFVVGYINKQYHAWNVVDLDGEEILYDPTAALGGVSGGQYSVERYY